MSRTSRGRGATLSRRGFVRLGGAGLAGAALLGVAGCGGDQSTAPVRMILREVGSRPRRGTMLPWAKWCYLLFINPLNFFSYILIFT
jgi:hypothetical protein